VAVLEPWIDAGARVVGLEPSCVSCLTEESPRLLGDESPALFVGVQVKEILSFLDEDPVRLSRALAGLGDDGNPTAGTGAFPAGTGAFPAGGSTRVIVHGHCQQKSAGWLGAAVRVLESVPGVRVSLTRAECCGMAGSYGYKPLTYELSRELGMRLLGEIDQIESRGRPVDEVLACGTSCRAQMEDLGGRRPRHPIELLAERLAVRDEGGRSEG